MPLAMSSAQSHNRESPPVDSNSTSLANAQPHNEESPSVTSKDTPLGSAQSHNRESPPVDRNSTSLANAQPHNEESPSVTSKDTPLAIAQSHNRESPPVDSKDTLLASAQSHNGEIPPVTGEDTALTNAQSNNGRRPSVNSKGTPLANAESHDGESPLVKSKDTALASAQSHDGERFLLTSKDTPLPSPQSHIWESPSVNSKDTTPQTSTQSHNGESSPVGTKGTSSNVDSSPANDESSTKGRNNWRYAAVGIAAGAAAVVAAPLVLGAAGFTAVASGSAFALLQSAGVVGITAAGKAAAIGGISGGIAAFGTKMFDNLPDIKLLICGCGSEAHALAGIASSVQGTGVRVLTSSSLLAKRWNAAVDSNEDLEVIFHQKGKEPTSIMSKPVKATNDPEVAMQDADIVVFVLPAFAHEVLLDDLKPYMKPGTIIVGLPGGPGFEFQVHEVLGDVARQCTIVNFESSPWVSRITKFGVKCEVLGTKETLLGAMKQGEGVAPKKDPVSTLQNLLGPLPKLNISGHLLGVTLMSTDGYLHPSILYGQWEGWDGKPLDEPPLFYNGLSEPAANLLSSVSDEIVNIGRALELKTEADMSNVVHIHQWHVRRYPHDISNKSTLYKAIQTNAPYQGIKHPVKITEDGKYMPDFTHRYMTEDVPCGLVAIRGVAEIVGVNTPNIDKVLTWCQEKMGNEYLVNSKLQGKDISSSRAPQRYGFTSLKSIL
ncbi:tauropine dehydrogenase-like isoform X2 [Oculina patagonica]